MNLSIDLRTLLNTHTDGQLRLLALGSHMLHDEEEEGKGRGKKKVKIPLPPEAKKSHKAYEAYLRKHGV